ncbi:muscle M-line assembly protein unc-89-like [Galendromus occidentalis]|uniref:Muscle M-line assembly protein unc-89-like n=1 Tax=Galendromus occidentalis TaxID=34638 RepID=A0AAJ7WGX0_9ACAR|nr:muscle M-line assembly protein unc-89-like [Galendromus occidentalis]
MEGEEVKTSLSSEGTFELRLVNVQMYDTGRYTCTAYNEYGQASSTNVLYLQDKGQRPIFVKALNPVETTDGSPVVFECRVVGTPTPSIRWFQNRREVKPSADFQPEFDAVTGFCRLVISEVYPDDQGIYTCRATNPFGEDETTAPLTVTDVELLETSDLSVQPRFLVPLEPTTALEGNPVEMKVEVIAVPPPAIQWFFHGRPITTSRDHRIKTKGKKSNLVIPEAFAEDSGPYEVSAVNIVGTAKTKANLTVIPLDEQSATASRKPQFLVELLPVTAQEGQRAVFRSLVSAVPSASISWYHKHRLIKSSRDFQIITEDNKSTLIINEVFPDDEGEFTCTAVNTFGMAQSKTTLTVEKIESSDDELEAPRILNPLKPLSVMDGGEAKFVVLITGHPQPKVTWFHNDVEVKQNEDIWMTQRSDGYCELFISEVFPEDMGEYVCKVTNKAGTVYTRTTLTVESYEYIADSEVATVSQSLDTTLESIHTASLSYSELDTDADFSIEIPDLPMDEPLSSSELASLDAKATGHPRPKITWYKNGEILKWSPDCQISYDTTGISTVTFHRTELEDFAFYVCEAKNAYGVDMTECELVQLDMKSMRPLRKIPTHDNKLKLDFKPQKPKFERGLKPEYLKPLGTPVTLEVIVRGRPKPEFTWYFHSEEITEEDSRFSMTVLNDRCMLHILELTSQTEGSYTFTAVNEHGQATTQTHVVVGEYEETAPLQPEQPTQTETAPQATSEDLVMLHYKVGTSEITDTAVSVTQTTTRSEIATRDTLTESLADSRLQYLPGPMEGIATEELPSQRPKTSTKTMGQQAREFASKIIPKPLWPFSMWSGGEQPTQPEELIGEAPHPAGIRPGQVVRETHPGEVIPEASKKPIVTDTSDIAPETQASMEFLPAEQSPIQRGLVLQPLQPGEILPGVPQSVSFYGQPRAPQFPTGQQARLPHPAFIRPSHPAYRPVLGVATTPLRPSMPGQASIQPVSTPQTQETIGESAPRKPIEVHMVPTRAGRWVPARKVSEPGTAPKFTCPLEEVMVTLGQPATLDCRVIGKPKPKVTWFKEGEPLQYTPDVKVSYDTEGTCQLVIPTTEEDHFGHYYVEAKNRYGVDVTHTELVQIG